MNSNFKILNNTYKTINYFNKLLINYPKKEIVLRNNIEKNKVKLDETISQIDEIVSQIDDENIKLDELQKRKEELRASVEELVASIEQNQASIFEVQNNVEKQKADIGVFKERIQNNNTKFKKFLPPNFHFFYHTTFS